jgi:hypothetical protein
MLRNCFFRPLISLDRSHWSLYPTIYEGRRLPLDAYDELMGILAHGCVGEPTESDLPWKIPSLTS